MKKKIILFLLILSGYPFSVDVLPVETDYSGIRVLYRAQQQATNDGTPYLVVDTMALDMEDSKSVYYDWSLHRKDSIAYRIFSMNKGTLSFVIDDQELEKRLELRGKVDRMLGKRKAETSRIFKNRLVGEIVTLDRESGYQYGYKVEESLVFDWEILPDTTTIFDYQCMKAVTNFRGRTYHAWFTMEIPVNDGPWKFYGLPGLILKVEDSDRVFSMTAFGLEKIDGAIFTVKDRLSANIEIIDYIQLNKFRQKKYERIAYGFVDGPTLISYFGAKNPISYTAMEVDE